MVSRTLYIALAHVKNNIICYYTSYMHVHNDIL